MLKEEWGKLLNSILSNQYSIYILLMVITAFPVGFFAGLFGFYVLQVVPQEQYLSIFFSFLAGITFPHVIVMGLMFNSNKSVT